MESPQRRWFGPGMLLIFALALCLPAGAVVAQEEFVWPVHVPLLINSDDAVQTWLPAGDVAIWNTHSELKLDVLPSGSYRIAKVAVHVESDPAAFAALLDKKGKPDLRLFDYVTEYKQAVASHRQIVDMTKLDICWSVNPLKCDPNQYIIVAVEFQGVESRAYASNGGMFDRLNDERDAVLWGFYATYPMAKVEPGHFVDANVSGLKYQTITQEGITGAEGQFWWLPGERVDFWVGNLWLGNALADRSVTPVDLFPGSDIEDDRVLNVARLLQSLDDSNLGGAGAININEPAVACLNSALASLSLPPSPDLFSDDAAVGDLIDQTILNCTGTVALVAVSKEEAADNLVNGMKAGNLMSRNISKTPGAKSDKAQIEVMPLYVPAKKSDGRSTVVTYYNDDGTLRESRNVAKPLVVSYLDEIEGTDAKDVFIAISLDDGDTWKRRNISKTASTSSLYGKPGDSWKPMLEVQDNRIFVAWTDKYCKGGRPAYAITTCPDLDEDGQADPCTVCRDTADGTVCNTDYPGDDAYWQDDLYGVGGPQRSVLYEDYPEKGEVPYSCVWAARGLLDPATGDVQWFKPERITSGRRDAYQLVAASHPEVGFAIAWQEDPKGLMPGEGDGPGEGWSGANTHNKADIWLSYLTNENFDQIDYDYPRSGFGDGDFVDIDPDMAGRAKALVPMTLPVKVSDNDICSLENMLGLGGGEHPDDEEGEGTHRYCGDPTLLAGATKDNPSPNPLCAYTIERTNPNGEVHNVCVTADGRLLDGNTGASRANLNLQPYQKADGTKSAVVVIGYEESKGVGVPPEEEGDCGDEESIVEVAEGGEDDHETRYKPDVGKNIIYHSFDLFSPELVSGGAVLNLPETDANGNPVYVVDEFGQLILDHNNEPILAYENARRVRFIIQPKKKAAESTNKTILVALYRQGEEGSGKPADIFMRRAKLSSNENPYFAGNFQDGAQNLTSVTPTVMFTDPYDADKPEKMLRWAWTPTNLADSSAKNPHTDARAHRGALNGDELMVAYSWTPNWGRKGNDKYDLYVRRSFDGGKSWRTNGLIEHTVAWRVPVLDDATQTVTWDEEVITTQYAAGELEPQRNVSNLRNNRTSVLEPRLVKTPGTISSIYNNTEDKQNASVFQLAWGLEYNQMAVEDGVTLPKTPLDILYGRTTDKGQHYENVVVTPQNGTGRPEEGFGYLAKDHPNQGAVQIRQTPDGSRMYAIWLEESADKGSDIMFRRVDYR